MRTAASRSALLALTLVACCKVRPGAAESPPSGLTARPWLRAAHQRLSERLPPADRRALTNDDLPRFLPQREQIYRHFGQDPRWVTSVFGNFWGLVHTSQATKGDPGEDQDFAAEPPAWPGFASTWTPVAEGAELFSRLGVHRDAAGRPETRDAVLIAVGLFGDLAGPRYRQLATELYQQGYHVLAVELRGHGRTGHLRPELPMTFGVLEAADLIHAAHWLKREHGARRVGLVGFSWGALDAILAAWVDGDPTLRDAGDPLWRRLPRPGVQPVFDGGVLALSPVLDVQGIGDSFERPASFLGDPARYYLQKAIRRYMQEKGSPTADHRVWPFVRFELARSSLGREFGSTDEALRRLVDFIQVQGPRGAAKLERVRVPLLLVHGANDPIAGAPQVVDLGRVRNGNVSVLLLPGSGHIGLSALSSSYYFGLILSFLDARGGPQAVPVRGTTVTAQGPVGPGEAR